MSMTLTMTKAYLEAKNFKHRVVEERNVIETGVGGLKNKGNIEIIIFFDIVKFLSIIKYFFPLGSLAFFSPFGIIIISHFY